MIINQLSFINNINVHPDMLMIKIPKKAYKSIGNEPGLF